MAIYRLFNCENEKGYTETFQDEQILPKGKMGHLFSTIATRLCFLFLFIADALWFLFNLVLFFFSFFGLLVTGGKSRFFAKRVRKRFIHLRRAIVCALSLLVGLISPPFGIMIGCTYFLMYDKKGMEDVIPQPLQAQFKNLFNEKL